MKKSGTYTGLCLTINYEGNIIILIQNDTFCGIWSLLADQVSAIATG